MAPVEAKRRGPRGRAGPISLTDEELDRIVSELSGGLMIENGRQIRYYKVPNRSAGSDAPSLRRLAEVALPDPKQRARERNRTRRLFARARELERNLRKPDHPS